ncbi:TPA: hypothetical protein L4Q87_000788 [Pseudomonas aeruginosa]|uniref:hypothetical protein n=1 Tax=Pseudomonas aeruginosa TaxID=287 RepID=UPI0032E3A522|nr:hypothetical protein [Pseudomonas aeruginosa]
MTMHLPPINPARSRLLYRSGKVALVVGTLLNLINQGDVLLGSAELSVHHLLLNYLVPFAVSAYSGLKAVHQNT